MGSIQWVNSVLLYMGLKYLLLYQLKQHLPKVQNYITKAPTCFAASAPTSESLHNVLLKYKILKLYRAVDRRMVNVYC